MNMIPMNKLSVSSASHQQRVEAWADNNSAGIVIGDPQGMRIVLKAENGQCKLQTFDTNGSVNCAVESSDTNLSISLISVDSQSVTLEVDRATSECKIHKRYTDTI